jgi:NADH-quinone oxidoreductase subunit J
MTLQPLFFYVFSAIAVASAFMVIAAKNPVHSVLFLILAFINSAGLFILLGAEFLAMILVVVYVGAVAVLFLFVVMMLDVDFGGMRTGFLQYLPVGATVGLILLVELVLVLGGALITPETVAGAAAPTPPVEEVSNTEAIGRLLYTRYVFFFQTAGMILLVAMVGAIVLTLRHRVGIKRQDISRQIARDPQRSPSKSNKCPMSRRERGIMHAGGIGNSGHGVAVTGERMQCTLGVYAESF